MTLNVGFKYRQEKTTVWFKEILNLVHNFSEFEMAGYIIGQTIEVNGGQLMP